MISSSSIVRAGHAVRDAINSEPAGTFYVPLAQPAEFAFRPSKDKLTVDTLNVLVVPGTFDSIFLTRNSREIDLSMQIGVIQNVRGADDPRVADLLALVETICDWAITRRFGDFVCADVATEPPYDAKALTEQNQFQSVITLTLKAQKAIVESAGFNADFNVTPAVGVAGLAEFTAIASATGDTDPYTLSVDWGDGTTTEGEQTTHTFATDGPRTITLTATSAGGTMLKKSKNINVTPPLSSSLEVSGTAGVADLTRFTAIASAAGGSSPYQFSIDWGDGSVSGNTGTGTHVYTTAGSFAITLTVTDAAGRRSTASKNVTITAATVSPGGTTPGWGRWPLRNGAKKIYVSSSTGNDSADGLTPATAVASLAVGYGKLANGAGDHLCLKADDVFNAQGLDWDKRGYSAQYPAMLTSYGVGGRPTIIPIVGDNGFDHTAGADYSNIAIVGIRFYAGTRDPVNGTPNTANATGIWWYGPGSNITIEDCEIRMFSTNVVFQTFGPDAESINNVTLRGNVIVDAYGVTAHAQGAYLSEYINGLLIEDNVFDHNGWHATVSGAEGTVYNHNIYIDNELRSEANVVRRNILSRAGSHGIQLRPGGEVSNNLVVKCPMGVLVGGGDNYAANSPGGVNVYCLDNVITESGDITPSLPRGVGIEGVNIKGGRIAGNIVTHDGSASPHANAHGINLDPPTTGLAVTDNIVWDWTTPRLFDPSITITETGNYYGALGGANTPGYAGPSRTVGSYNLTLAGAGTTDAFLTATRGQSKASWRPELSASAVNAYMRAGFATAASSAPVPTSISATGSTLSILVGDVQVCSGDIKLVDVATLWPTTPLRPSVENPADGITYTVSMSSVGDTVEVEMVVTNNHPTLALPWLSIELPELTFCPSATPGADFGRTEAIATSWRDNTWDIAHPIGARQPIGAWRIATGGVNAIGWGFNPIGEEETPKNLIRRAGIPQTRPLFFIKKSVAAAGGTATVRFTIRVSGNTDARYLWAPYKASYSAAYPSSYYSATWEPVAAAYAMTQTGLVNPATNPYGYKALQDMTGASPTDYVSGNVAALVDLGYQSLYLWDACGIDPADPVMLNPKFAPTRIANAMTAVCAAAGSMAIGMGARMGIVTDSGLPSGYRSRLPEEDSTVLAEWDRALGWGVSAIYGDEMGARTGDLSRIKAVRAAQVTAGKTASGMVERFADVMGPFVGAYTNVVADAAAPGGFAFWPNLSATEVAVLHWLRPGLPVYAQIRSPDATIEAAYRFCIQHGVIPLIPWWDAARLTPIYRRVLDEVAPQPF